MLLLHKAARVHKNVSLVKNKDKAGNENQPLYSRMSLIKAKTKKDHHQTKTRILFKTNNLSSHHQTLSTRVVLYQIMLQNFTALKVRPKFWN